MGTTNETDYCTETYFDALSMDASQIEREQTELCRFMSAHWRALSWANQEILLREKRAYSRARSEQIRRARER